MLFNFGLKKNIEWIENIHIVSQVGFTISGCVLFCAFIGCWIGYHLEFKVTLSLIFAIFGTIGGFGVCTKQLFFITVLFSSCVSIFDKE